MAQNGTPQRGKGLKPNQIKAMEALLSGKSVGGAAEEAGVSRTTLHRWLRENWEFQAALNQRQQELVSAVQAGLLTAASRATAVVSRAIDEGDLRAAIALLKGLGLLSGSGQIEVGPDDPNLVRAEAELAEKEAASERFMRSLVI